MAVDGQTHRFFKSLKRKIEQMVVSALLVVIGLWLLGVAFFFGSVGLAFYCNEVLGSAYKGFYVVGAIHFIIFLLFYILSKLVRR